MRSLEGSAHDDRIDAVLDIIREHLGMDIAWLSEFTGGEQILRAAAGALGDTGVGVGSATALDASYCTRVVDGRLPPMIPDAQADPRTRALPITMDLGIGSYVGAPLRDADGMTVGMLCCLSASATPELVAGDARFIQLLARLLGADLVRWMSGDEPALERSRLRLQRLVADRALDAVFQPVLDLRTGRCAGYEALSRFDPAYGSPADLFTDAAEVDLGVELELLAVERALEHVDELPPDTWLSVNLSPATVLSEPAFELLTMPCSRPLVVELTEHVEIPDYAPLLSRVKELRERGVRIATDDAGAGYAGLQHILQLRPDIIKMDIGIVRDVHQDPVRQALAHSLATFAESIGAVLLAEGVEQHAELDMLARIGVDLAQGYLVAKPGGLPGPVSFPQVGVKGRRIDGVTALQRVAKAVARAEDEESLVRPMLDIVLDVTGLDSAYLASIDTDADTIEVRYVRNAGALVVPEGRLRRWEGSLCQRCEERGTLWSADVPKELAAVPLAAAEGVRTFVSVPITGPDGRLVGSVAGASATPVFISESDLLTLRVLTHLVGHGGAPLRRPVPLETLPSQPG